MPKVNVKREHGYVAPIFLVVVGLLGYFAYGLLSLLQLLMTYSFMQDIL